MEKGAFVIIVLKPNILEAEIEHLIEKIESKGLKVHLSRGTVRTVIGVVGDERKLDWETLQAVSGVDKVMPVLSPYKLASREFHLGTSQIPISTSYTSSFSVKVGGSDLAIIAGPCAVETEEQTLRIAQKVKSAGANILRGGAFKPRTSPYAFQGHGEDGLKILALAREETGLPICTEVMDTRTVEIVARYADILQIGTRNMQNFNLLSEAGKSKKPILLKRGWSSTIEEWLLCAEYILSEGNPHVILCERGIRTFETATRNTLDVSAIPVVRELSHLPILVDPSHSGGRRAYVSALSKAGVAAGCDGILIDVHDQPEEALVDGAQAVVPQEFQKLMSELRTLSKAVGRSIQKIDQENIHEKIS